MRATAIEASRLAELELAVTRQQKQITDYFQRTLYCRVVEYFKYTPSKSTFVELVFGKNLSTKSPTYQELRLTGSFAKWDQFIPLKSPTYRDSTVA